MSHFRCIFSLFVLMASMWHGALFGQDTAKVVILSERVGPDIELEDQRAFRLFGQIKDFYCATVYQRPDSTFFVRIVLQSPDGTRRDTTIDYPSTLLLMMAEKINHFEGLERGTYRFGTDPAALHFAEGGSVSFASVKSARRGSDRSSAGKIPQRDSVTVPSVKKDTALSPIVERAYPDRLPLVPDSISEDLLDGSSVNCWLGAGLSWYSPGYEGLASSYRSVEAQLRSLGAPVSLGDPAFAGSGILWLDLRMRLAGDLLGTIEAGTQIGSDTKFSSISVGLQYNLPYLVAPILRPFIAAALGSFKIHAEQAFDIPLKDGGTFKGIIIDASHFGSQYSVGIEVGRSTVVSISASYLSVPVVHQTTYLGTDANMDMSSFLISARVLVAW